MNSHFSLLNFSNEENKNLNHFVWYFFILIEEDRA